MCKCIIIRMLLKVPLLIAFNDVVVHQVHNLGSAELKKREVVMIDIANDHVDRKVRLAEDYYC